MFKKQLEHDLLKIFGIDIIRFESVSESQEQAAIFVEIEKVISTIKEKEQLYRVDCRVRLFARSEALPFGFLMKQIQAADPNVSQKFFFYDLEENAGTFQNINERSFKFIYFYNSEFDPDRGELTEIQF